MAINLAIDNCEMTEKRLAADYIKLNPADKERRERDKKLILYAFMIARLECKKELNKTIKELESLNA